jgi:hypothetical protein
MNPAAIIADQFLQEHEVEIKSKGAFPGWNSRWIVDGHAMSTQNVKKMLIPIVRESVGINPSALKAVIWKLIKKTMSNVK